MIGATRNSVLLYDRRAPQYILKELSALASVVGIAIVESVSIRNGSSRTRISDFKLNELKKKLIESNSDIVLLEPELFPSQKIAIMKKTGAEVIDRTMLLLEVFERNAGSREAKLQIEVAKHKHELPLLRELINRSKRGELPGFMSGGTYAIDRHYRQIRKEIAKSREELDKIRKRRAFLRERRKEIGLPSIAIVGYANAGKTSLFNFMTGSNRTVGPIPFTTISPKVSRHRSLPIALVDTVGFVLNVPPEIVEAFYGTLEEIGEAGGMIFVIDISEEEEVIREQMIQAASILSNLDSIYKPISIAANKIDVAKGLEKEKKMREMERLERDLFPNKLGIFPISALRGEGVDKLEGSIWRALNQKQEYLG